MTISRDLSIVIWSFRGILGCLGKFWGLGLNPKSFWGFQGGSGSFRGNLSGLSLVSRGLRRRRFEEN